MTPLFQKLNLKDQSTILVLEAPASFEPELAALTGISIQREADRVEGMTFVLAFVMTQAAVDTIAAAVVQKLKGDGVVWFAYPKSSSKKYQCEFNRDTGWAVLGTAGFEAVRQVAIDADWSALRFRRVEFIKTLSRDRSRSITAEGKARIGED
jgi:hypothetical protein